MRRGGLSPAALGALFLCAAGCNEPVTQVVVAITSDLAVPTEADTISIFYQPGDQTPPSFGSGLFGSLTSFPLSAGFFSGGEYPSFSIAVQLTRFGQQVVVSRRATGIRFVEGETRMLVLAMPRACACQGTTCPNPEDQPECAHLVDPPLEALDPAVAPRGSEVGTGVPTTPGVPPPRALM